MTLPLAGRRIVITRAVTQQDELADLLSREGAEVLFYPAIRITPPEDTRSLDDALHALVSGAFEWVVFTSANTVMSVAARLAALRYDFPSVSVAAIGSATANAVQKAFATYPDFVPDHFDSCALVDALPLTYGIRVLLPQSELAANTLTAVLTDRGAQVTQVSAYRVLQGNGGVDLPKLAQSRSIDAITFTSGSTVDYFAIRFTQEGGKLADLHPISLAAMGASTVRALTSHALTPAICAPENIINSLVHIMKDAFHA